MSIVAIGAAGAFVAEETAQFDPNAVTPGVLGFAFTALFALAVILLGISLVRRLRRNQYRHEIRQELEAELSERDAATRGDGAADRGAEAGPGAASGNDPAADSRG